MKAMQAEGSPFNGDEKMQDEFLALKVKYGISTVIETGTYKADTTLWLAEHFDIVYTVEVNETYHQIAEQRLAGIKNVSLSLGDSVEFLNDIKDACGPDSIVFLDAHWYKNPLLGELEVLARNGCKPVLIIHDFFNPEHPEYQFDKYPAQQVEYTWDYVKAHVEKIYGADGYEKYYNRESTGQPKIGCLFVVPKST